MLRRTAVAISALMLVTAAQALAPSAASAAGPSVPLPDAPSTPVSPEAPRSRPADQATTAALRGEQPAGQGSSLPGGSNTQATSLSASASWSVSGYTGTFTWSYPFRVPPAPGGLEPKLALSYSSSAVDGRTSSTNNQASWVGDGWDLTPGFVERSYGSCAEEGANNGGRKSGDLCWRSDNANASYNGSSGPLIRDDGSGVWRPKGDDGSRVEKLSGAGNGARGGEYWKITTVDGTQYFFGSQSDSRSTWTVPVLGDPDSGAACKGVDAVASSCTQAWRWNLDKVVDRHGNVVRYYYTPETDNYGFNLKDAPVSYVRGGTLERVDYGLREDGGQAVGRVVFGVADRCVPGATCDRAHPQNWPDVPWDSTCEAAPCTNKYSPSFFSTKRLDTVTTKVWRGNDFGDVDSWKLDHQFPDPGDGEKASLWLKGVTHTGLVGGSISLPQVTFEGRAMANRVKGPTVDGYAPLLRYRVTGIVSEAGGVVDVHYADPDCRWGVSMPDEAHPENNLSRCFPVRWVPGSGFEPRVDYFHKYVVDTVTQLDRYGSSVGDVTSYEYLDGAAWHYDTSEFTPADKKTWSEFRGFGRVRVRRGDGKDSPRTLSEQRFYRGMHGDTLPGNGSRSVTFADSEGNSRTDEDWLAGYPFEQTTFDGEGGPAIGKTLSWPVWRGPTATRAGFKAYWTGTSATESYTALDGDRGWRVSRTDNEFDDVGLPTKVNQVVDTGKPAEAKCTTTAYVRNTGAWLLALPSRVQTVGTTCGNKSPVFPDHAISDVRTSYDGQDFGAAPTRGDITRTEQLKEHPASGPVYVTTSTATYDAYGRPLTMADSLNRTTRTAYAPTTGGPVTKVTTTDPAGFEMNTEFEPAWGVPVKATDVNLKVTESAYDALGRLTDSWLPNRPRSGTANVSYSYLVRNDAPTAVTTKTIGPNGRYTSSVVLHDGLLRPRQTQAPAVGGGRLLTDTRYDSQGRAWKSTQAYYNSAAVDTDLWLAADSAVPAMTTTEYDGAGRAVASVFRVTGDEKWRITTGYGGDRVYTTPPTGGIATTVVNDAYGRTSELWQHKGGTPTGDHDTTKYTYTLGGQLATTVDPAGNTWSWTYDLRGRMIHANDPDKGNSDSSYDDAGQLLSTKDSAQDTLVHEYDVLGRRTTLHRDSPTGPLLAKWDYDTAYKGKGLLSATTRYDSDGNAYTKKITSYNLLYQPGGIEVGIPASEDKLAGTYRTVFGYNPDGSLAAEGLPKAGNLAAETVMHTYDDLGLPDQTSGGDGNATVFIASSSKYTRYGESARLTLGVAGQRAWISNYYEDGSRRLKTSIVDAEVAAPMQAKVDYTYDAAGNITGISDAPTGAVPDHQCFTHDHLQRLVEAWTPGNGDCGTAPKKEALGGAAPYWHTYGYDATGNRTSEVQHGVGTAGDVSKVYHYPLPGEAQPHALKSVSVDGVTVDSYAYDSLGNTTKRAIAGEPAAHVLDWDVEGRLTSDTAGSAVTSFVDDADGNRLIREDPTSVTLYLGSQEIKLDKSTKSLTTTRYYSHGGQVVAQRTRTGVEGLTWLASDHHGTAQIAVQPGTMAVTKRRSLPFGAPRGAAVTWANDRGFVGGTKDADGLVHLGAREYDPSTGRFVSVDPLLAPDDPQQLNGYAYANNSPATFSDPSGLIRHCGPDNVGCGGIKGDPKPSQEARDAWNNRGGPGTGGSNGNSSSTLRNVEESCGPVRTVFVNPDNNPNLSGYLLTITTVQYTGILHVTDCRANGVMGPCTQQAGDYQVGWSTYTVSSATRYQCGENDRTPGCGPFVSNGGPTTAEALVEIGKLIFDPTACVGSGASVGACSIEIAGILPVGKILKGAKITSEALEAAVKACHSFVAETRVLMADGSTEPISEVEIGDRVKATDPETGVTTDREVTATFVHGDEGDALVELTVTGQDGSTGSVEGTSWHPVWLAGEHRFVNLGDLKEGQHLTAVDGSSPTITSVQDHARQGLVYDLTVDSVHTYYVLAGDTSVLVHNCGKGKLSDPLPRGMNNDIALAYDDVKAGNIPSHNVYAGREHRWWAGSREYRVPGRPETERILEKELPNGVKVYGWTTTHYRKIQRFSAPHFPDSGWN